VNKAIIQYYRRLLKADFGNSGEIENASVFVEAIGEKMVHCGNSGNYMQIYLDIEDDTIVDIRYLCSCEPTANVGVEVLCDLARGKTLDEALAIGEDRFYREIGCDDDELKLKVRGLIEMLHEAVARYRNKESGNPAAENIQW
jgi:NifU-like protein involved in Fe-S cluster formation